MPSLNSQIPLGCRRNWQPCSGVSGTCHWLQASLNCPCDNGCCSIRLQCSPLSLPYMDGSISVLDALYLQAVELDRRFAAKHVYEYLQLALLWVDFVDSAIKALERTVDDVYHFAKCVIYLVLWLF